MIAILKREIKAYFTSMLGYVYLTIFLLLSAWMFINSNIQQNSASMTNFFYSMISWSIFILPILTMRLFAEDRKSKTDQLLMTAPIGSHEIVLGKFLGAVGAFLVGVAVTLIYPIILSFYGNIPIAETISTYIGYILFCSCIISIGAFMSSITESQIVAAISTYGIMILVIFMGLIASLMPTEFLQTAVLWISPLDRFNDFVMGVLNINSIVYYISLTVVFLFFTVRVFEKRRLN